MTTVTINDKDYETDAMSDKDKGVVQLLQQNLVSVNMLEHWLQCVRFVGEMKTKELERSLNGETEMVRARNEKGHYLPCLLYTSPSPRDGLLSRMPSSA